jgi:hypothetical protein
MNASINELISLKIKLIQIVNQLLHAKLKGGDIYIYGILYRSYSLIDGFLQLVESNNFLCALSLVRLHIDSLCRLYAPTISELNFEEFAHKVMYEEIQIRDLNSKFKKSEFSFHKLTDNFLIKKISEEKGLEWIYKGYKSANGFVHFSDKHIFTSISAEENGYAKFLFGRSDRIPENEKEGAVKLMSNITLRILSLTETYLNKRTLR